MADQLTTTTFNYENLDGEAVAGLERHAAAIAEEQAGVRRRAAEGVIRVGRDLAEAHDILAGKGREGLFRPWVQERCKFSYRTAYNAIQASETFGTKKCETVSHFFDVAAMYLLSGDSCPLAATEAAIRLAKKGQHITKKLAEELREKYSEPAEDDNPYYDPHEQAAEGKEPADRERETGEAAGAVQETPRAQDELAPAEETAKMPPPVSREEPSPVSPPPSAPAPPPAPPSQQSSASVLGALRSAVMELAHRTSDKANLVRSLRTLAVPGMMRAVAGALQGYPAPAVGNFLSTLAEEIEETDA